MAMVPLALDVPDSMIITDVVAPDAALFVDTSGGDPVVFADGAVVSGLSYNYATDVAFSNQVGGGPPYTYSPTPDAQGYDPAVTGFRINPTGAVNGASGGSFPSFSLLLNIRVQ